MEPEIVPEDAETIKQLLESMGVSDYDPRVVEQLMDFMYRYTAEVLQDAEAVSSRSGLPAGEVNAQDVMLAIQSKGQHSFVPPPPQQLLLNLAELRNKAPLPELRLRHGLRIPPEGECLLNPNFQLQPTNREPFLPATAMDVDAVAARQTSAHNIEKKHVVSMDTPAEGWQPGPDAPAEPWPGSNE